jgi:hypothetical protein
MQDAFGYTPFAWQDDILCHLLKMASTSHSIAPAPTFLCQPTGGGKSLVRDVFASGRGGVTWCIGPLLALGADQESKINKRSLSNDGKTFALHLDEYRTEAQLFGIWEELNAYTRQSELAVVVLTSPQILCSSSTIRNMFMTMLDSGALQLLCVDEAHLFVQFGLFFREEFIQLKSLLFEKLLLHGTSIYTKIPILFMTATANQTILSQLERITGYIFQKQNVFWPPAPQMLEPKVRMTFRYTPMPMLALKKRLEPLYKVNERRQWLLFANSRKELENDHLKAREFLDVANLPGDIVMINGPMFREQKFFYTNLFLNPELVDIVGLLRGDDESNPKVLDPDVATFDAIGCLATRSLGSAGWDGENVRLVFSVDFPTDLCSCTQEKGRAGRWRGAGPQTDEYYVCATLHSFLYLLKRIYRDEKDKDFAASDKIVSQKEYRSMLFDDLILVAKMFVLPT